jgi:hypothetical protein
MSDRQITHAPNWQIERDEARLREAVGDLQTADIEFIDDILSIVWEAGLLEVDE